MPVMLLYISIALFWVGIAILIWARAARSASWDDGMKVSNSMVCCNGTRRTDEKQIAFVASLAGVFAPGNYAVGASMLYQKRT